MISFCPESDVQCATSEPKHPADNYGSTTTVKWTSISWHLMMGLSSLSGDDFLPCCTAHKEEFQCHLRVLWVVSGMSDVRESLEKLLKCTFECPKKDHEKQYGRRMNMFCVILRRCIEELSVICTLSEGFHPWLKTMMFPAFCESGTGKVGKRKAPDELCSTRRAGLLYKLNQGPVSTCFLVQWARLFSNNESGFFLELSSCRWGFCPNDLRRKVSVIWSNWLFCLTKVIDLVNQLQGDRMWTFTAALFLLELFPGTLLLPAIYGFITGICVILMGSVIGEWVDATPRLKGKRLI